MTVSSAVAKSGPYTGADDFVFAYNFRVFADAELQVTTVVIATGVEEILTLTTDYTVQDAGDPTGTITLTAGTFPTGLPSTKKLVVSRDMGFLQEIDFENQGGFFPDTHEDGLDRLKMEVQQVKEEVDRSVKVDITGTTTPDDLLTEIDVSVAAAAASAAAAETAETNAETAETNAETAQTAAEAAQAAAEAAQAAAEAVDAYTKTELDAGQLDNRYYTETEVDANTYSRTQLDAGQLDTRYYTETEADAQFALKPVNAGTLATTSGTSVEWTGLPSWVTKLTLIFNEVSLNAVANMGVVIGDSGGYHTSGYVGNQGKIVNTSNTVISGSTDEFGIRTGLASDSLIGRAIIERADDTSDTWVFTISAYNQPGEHIISGGNVTLDSALDRVKLQVGSGLLDAGDITLLYQ